MQDIFTKPNQVFALHSPFVWLSKFKSARCYWIIYHHEVVSTCMQERMSRMRLGTGRSKYLLLTHNHNHVMQLTRIYVHGIGHNISHPLLYRLILENRHASLDIEITRSPSERYFRETYCWVVSRGLFYFAPSVFVKTSKYMQGT